MLSNGSLTASKIQAVDSPPALVVLGRLVVAPSLLLKGGEVSLES